MMWTIARAPFRAFITEKRPLPAQLELSLLFPPAQSIGTQPNTADPPLLGTTAAALLAASLLVFTIFKTHTYLALGPVRHQACLTLNLPPRDRLSPALPGVFPRHLARHQKQLQHQSQATGRFLPPSARASPGFTLFFQED